MNIFITLSYIFIIDIIFLLPMFLLNKKLKIKSIDKIVLILSYVLGFTFIGIMISFCFYIFFWSIVIVFNFIYLISLNFFSEAISKYLGLTFVLIIGAYFPEKIGYFFMFVLSKISHKNNVLSEFYISFVKFLSIKVWIYLFAFLITLISSIENVGNIVLISYSFWTDIKPYIYLAVVTFIAFDRFIKVLSDKKDGVTLVIRKIFDQIRGKNCEKGILENYEEK